jgi:hypothetical protein
MMHMMMMQNQMDKDRREQQNKADTEQREREYQLRREEMAIARKEARDQRQFMNLLFMSMLKQNGGIDNSNLTPPGPGPGNNACVPKGGDGSRVGGRGCALAAYIFSINLG